MNLAVQLQTLLWPDLPVQSKSGKTPPSAMSAVLRSCVPFMSANWYSPARTRSRSSAVIRCRLCAVAKPTSSVTQMPTAFSATRNPAISAEVASQRMDAAWMNCGWKSVRWHGMWTTYDARTGAVLDEHPSVRAFEVDASGLNVTQMNTHFWPDTRGTERRGPFQMSKQANMGPRGMYHPWTPNQTILPLESRDMTWSLGDLRHADKNVLGFEHLIRPGEDLRTSVCWSFSPLEHGRKLTKVVLIREQAEQPWPSTFYGPDAECKPQTTEDIRHLFDDVEQRGRGLRTTVDLDHSEVTDVHWKDILLEAHRDDAAALKLPSGFYAVSPESMELDRAFSVCALRQTKDAITTWESRFSGAGKLEWFQRTNFPLCQTS